MNLDLGFMNNSPHLAKGVVSFQSIHMNKISCILSNVNAKHVFVLAHATCVMKARALDKSHLQQRRKDNSKK